MARRDPLRILLFAKAPAAGASKTRLIVSLGAAGASQLHRALVLHQLDVAATARLAPVELWCAPDTSHPLFRACAAQYGVTLHAQRGADLGARMHHALDDALGRAEAALLVGCDLPQLNAAVLAAAARALQDKPWVLGPTEDGGYGLVGTRRSDPRVFADIPWGGAGVMATTRARLQALRCDWHELTPLWDVDRPADLARLSRLPGWAQIVDALAVQYNEVP